MSISPRVIVLPAILSLCGLSLAVADAAEFFRGVNVNGDAVTIDGHRWDGDEADYFEGHEEDAISVDPGLSLKPGVEGDKAEMIRSFRWNDPARFRITGVPDGTYTVWVYVMEDSQAQTFDIALEGMAAKNGVHSGPAGTWQKVGPFAVEVDDGAIEIASRGGGDANFCGIEIWKGKVSGAKVLKPEEAPNSPFLGRFSDRKPRVVVMTDIGGDPDDRQSLARRSRQSAGN